MFQPAGNLKYSLDQSADFMRQDSRTKRAWETPIQPSTMTDVNTDMHKRAHPRLTAPPPNPNVDVASSMGLFSLAAAATGAYSHLQTSNNNPTQPSTP